MPLLRHWYLAYPASRELGSLDKAFIEHATRWAYDSRPDLTEMRRSA